MIYIVGTGPMAQGHAKVLVYLEKAFTVIGRGKPSADSFYDNMGIQPFIGGINAFLNSNQFNEQDSVIIATGTEALMSTLKKALLAGAGKVLIEKPAAISIEELLENEEFLRPFGNKVFVAYNRRFYASVAEAMKLIEEDGGLESMHFEFTEWAHKIEPLDKAPGVKENWFFANSTHVVDLAFFIAGKPKEWSAYAQSGKLDWHNKTKFAGAGITDNGVIFSYHSNWESAGRWGIELNTHKRKIILKPLESIFIQELGSIERVEHEFNDGFDVIFKPGLINQLAAFLSDYSVTLCNLHDHVENTNAIYNKMVSSK